MDKRMVQAWKGHWEAVAAVQSEEQRWDNVAQRSRQLNALVRLARRHGMAAGDSGEDVVWRRWARLKGAGA